MLFAALIISAACAHAIDTRDLKIALSLASDDSGDDSESSYSWAMDGTWALQRASQEYSLKIDSDFSRSDDASEFNRLKTWWRYMWKDVPATRWRPLVLISTEGDHGLHQVHTLGAFGYQRKYSWGILEFTAGASKDVKTAESWVGDVGALIDYQQRWGKLTMGVNPSGELGVLGEVRRRADDFRYSVDTNLDYEIGSHLQASYRLHFGNTTKDSRRSQFLGITYRK